MKKKINMMSEIAEKYGLELNGLFCIFNKANSPADNLNNKKYKFTEDGFTDEYDCGGYGETLVRILRGEYFVEKVPEFTKPIECKENEYYRFVRIDGHIDENYFTGTTWDYILRKQGNMFSVKDNIPQCQIDSIVKQMKGE